MNSRVVFDRFVLKPLWLLFLCAAVYFLVQKDWLIGVLMLIANLFLGMIAASLHKEKTFSELAGGYPTENDFHSADYLSDNVVNRAITIAYLKTCILIFAVLLILGFHYGLKWYYSFGIAVLVSWLGPLILLMLYAFTMNKNRTQE